jgi:hypothetical protein
MCFRSLDDIGRARSCKIACRVFQGCWREKERERGEDKGLKKHFVILLMASGAHKRDGKYETR